ncbi:dystroglycan-like [Dorcoceras hygrometricum]|uniref:Dystroglycan-like n=1 Tax=Dorcoceras hygrometricum TaxID=472368 RepID=A0A2Z7B137_9LAMI|nr:dystroglycan-like [Dorcoceras hygrometricum]
MASSFYNNSQLIDFDSVPAMDDQGMVSMFQAIIESGLTGFLGCPAVIYEAALVDFFENASFREGVIISTVAGQLVEISEEWFAESFDILVDGLGDLSEIPKNVSFDARSIVSLSVEPVSLSGKKNQMKIEFHLLCDIMAKSISVKAGSFNAITVEKFSMVTAVVCGVRMNWASILFSILKKMMTPGSKQAKGFAVQISLLLENIPNLELGESSEFPSSKILTEKTVHRFVSLNDKVGAEEAAGAPKPKAASKKRQDFAAVGAPVIKKKRTMRKKSTSSQDNLEIVAVAQEAVPIQMFEPITVAPAAEDISDQPAGETDGVKAVAADVDATAEKIDEQVAEPSADVETSVGDFKKLATINIEELSRKEEQVLIWGETEITHVALSRKRYILLKYREVLVRKFLESWKNNFVPGKGSSAVDLKVIDILSDLHLLVLEELREQALAHSLKWTRTCCSKIVEGSPRDQGAIIARTNTNTPSTCWLRTMIHVDGVWVVEPFCDQWVKIPGLVVCTEVSKQCSFVDFFPAVSEPLRILRKRWADICLEIVGFCASRRLLPVGSINFSRSLSVVEPVFRVAPRQSPVFAMRVSQFCSVFIDYSLFSWLPTVDITNFLSSIDLERTALRQVQRSFASSVAPHVQLLDEQSSSSSNSDESMNFDDSTSTSLPAAPIPDVTIALNQLRASIEQLRERDYGGAKNKDTLLFTSTTLRRKSSHASMHKIEYLGRCILTTGLDVVDVRRVVRESHQELNARINSLDEQVAATRHDLLEFSAQAQQTLNIITSQLSELVAYINRGGDNKKGESNSSRRPLPTPVHQSEGTGDAVRITEPTQADIDNANRAILERMRNDDRG